MKLTIEQYEQIKDCFPKQRKPAKISSLEVLNAELYIVENGSKWRSLLKESGDWHVIYVRVNRWAKKGVLQAVFLHLQQLGIIQVQVNAVSLDSTCIYEGDETRILALALGHMPVVPPKKNRKNPWSYDERLYKQRNQVERLFRRIKRFRRAFTRYDNLMLSFSPLSASL